MTETKIQRSPKTHGPRLRRDRKRCSVGVGGCTKHAILLHYSDRVFPKANSLTLPSCCDREGSLLSLITLHDSPGDRPAWALRYPDVSPRPRYRAHCLKGDDRPITAQMNERIKMFAHSFRQSPMPMEVDLQNMLRIPNQ